MLFALATLIVAGCNGLFFYPQKELRSNPVAEKFAPQDVYFPTTDGLTLHGWFLASREPQGTVVVFHGNAENLSTHVNSVLWLVKEGFNVFIIDYRGYGRSEGTPTVEGIMIDGRAALDTVYSLNGVDSGRVAVLGQSIGGAVAIHAVATSPRKIGIRVVIVEGAFTGFRNVAREKLGSFYLTWPIQYPLSWFFTDDYSPREWIAQVSPVPLLILQGTDDPVIPAHHGRLLYEAARPPKTLWLTPSPGHVQSFADTDLRARVANFIRDAFSVNPGKGQGSLTVDK
jgi:hypothetical protein